MVYVVQQSAVRQHDYKLEQRVIYIFLWPILGMYPEQSMCNLPYRLVTFMDVKRKCHYVSLGKAAA